MPAVWTYDFGVEVVDGVVAPSSLPMSACRLCLRKLSRRAVTGLGGRFAGRSSGDLRWVPCCGSCARAASVIVR